MTSLPDRRAWMTTAFVTTFVAGAVVAVPLLTHLGADKSDTIVTVDAPISSRATTTPTATPTSTPATTTVTSNTTTTVTGKPQVSVATATVTVTAPGGQVTVVKPGTTVTLPPTTTTVTAPARVVPPPATLTATTTTTVTTKVTEEGQQTAGQKGGAAVPTKDPKAVRPQSNHPARLRNEGSKLCLDVQNGRAGTGTDGTPLQIWDCHDAGGQTWTFKSDGTVGSLNQCMDLAWGSIAENTAVQLVACNGSAAQQFRINTAKELVNPAARDKCVTVAGGKNGRQLFLRTCTGDGTQKWQRTPTDADRKSGIHHG